MYVFFKAQPSSLLFLCYQYRDYSTFLLDWVVLAVMHSVNNVSLVTVYSDIVACSGLRNAQIPALIS